MTIPDWKAEMLAILDTEPTRESLNVGGAEGCLLQRVFDPDNPAPEFHEASGLDIEAVADPNDAYVDGTITLAELRKRIEAL
jgi:hypothetical protein